MFKLIKLEVKKYKMKSYLKALLIAIIIINLVMLQVIAEGNKSTLNTYVLGETLVQGVFMIFSSVLISNIIVGEYNSKTINLMFMYPIKRKNIILSKLFLISLFIFIAMIIGNISLYLNYYIFHMVTKVSLPMISLSGLFWIVLDSLVFTILSLFPVYIGVKYKKTQLTIVSGIILTSLLNSDIQGFNLASIKIISIMLTLISLLFIVLAIRVFENEDFVS
ncbi:ABC transporter permease [Clostridium felsineum]|uniref:Uncharacterized protein n=1 Tax=Clostridium felsineum TaxID=36839 RepID=A0A1S8L0B8_9CLOT|nr:ABC transporter permease [Clostridium felsineum]URZ00081.1 hypothetical protein CLAUR_000640 [Clostridium felsineum]URZ07274.1 hypothetical protein CLROS_026120 [Clostridium felsineum]URZ12305.1 hypothetical protein CROST_030270 [Clostridium felsineum]URZ16970.1 hypothetical protein CLFE_030220 [Clostridium felsineum DSM 794]